MQRYLHRLGENEKPLEIPIVEQSNSNQEKPSAEEASASHEQPSSSSEDLNLQQLDRVLPKTRRERGKLLYELLKRDPELSWNRENVVNVRGSQLQGTNIVDLVANAVKTGKRGNPVGWVSFVKELTRANVSKQLLGTNVLQRRVSSSPRPRARTSNTPTNTLGRWRNIKM